MERLKVLFVTAWYPGKERPLDGVFVREHAKAVQLYDDLVVLHIAGPDPKLKQSWLMERVVDEDLTEGIPTYRVWYQPPWLSPISYSIQAWSILQSFRRIVAEGFQPDIIHAHVYYAGAHAVILGKIYHIPVVVTEHSSAFPRKLLRRLDVWKARFAFQGAHVVMPVSRALQQAIEDYGIKAQFRVIPNVVDTNLFYPDPASNRKGPLKHLLFVGTLDPSHVKGVPYLLYALAELRQQRDDWCLDIMGDGPARTGYEHLVADLELADKVTFHGAQPKKAVADFMRLADIFVLPSVWENLPCVALEAMATGLPIVSTLSGGIPEVVDKQTGRLVPAGDVRQLSTTIAQMLESLEEFDRCGIAQKAHRYSPESVGSLIHSTYEDCLFKR